MSTKTTTEKAASANQEEMVKIKLPRIPGTNAKQQMFFGHNFKNYIVKTGEVVEVPKFIAENIEQSERLEEESNSYSDSVAMRE